jgi:hypothetical protein
MRIALSRIHTVPFLEKKEMYPQRVESAFEKDQVTNVNQSIATGVRHLTLQSGEGLIVEFVLILHNFTANREVVNVASLQ